MSLDELKLKKSDFIGKTISELPDAPSDAGMSAEDLKLQFDMAVQHVLMPKYNALVDFVAQVDAEKAEEYKGEYIVTPSMKEQVLQTENTKLKENVTIEAVPYAEVTNESGGITVTII